MNSGEIVNICVSAQNTHVFYFFRMKSRRNGTIQTDVNFKPASEYRRAGADWEGIILKNEERTVDQVAAFATQLRREERSGGTIAKYLRDVGAFASWLDGRAVTRELAAEWKEHLLDSGYRPVTVNSMVAGINKYFVFAGWNECRVKPLRLQRRLFRSEERELTRSEYDRLVDTAQELGRPRLALLMETICATGIRVSEVQYLTVKAVREGRTEISLKGKIRTILLPGKLCSKLKKYARQQHITSGQIFLTKNGNGLSRKQIWAEMKALAAQAKVKATKVFPHNLRHLFARAFYKVSRDVAKLADVLGHSSMETTRIYLVSTGAEHARQLERLDLIR